MKPFGSGRVVVTDGKVTDDGDFYTANGDPVTWRWFAIYTGAVPVFGMDPPLRYRKGEPPPQCFQTRSALAAFPLASVLQPGRYTLRIWGGVDTDPDWYEIGSSNPQDNGATDVTIATTFELGAPPPPVDPMKRLREGVEQLENSNAYAAGFTNVVQGTRKCRQALDVLGSQP